MALRETAIEHDPIAHILPLFPTYLCPHSLDPDYLGRGLAVSVARPLHVRRLQPDTQPGADGGRPRHVKQDGHLALHQRGVTYIMRTCVRL